MDPSFKLSFTDRNYIMMQDFPGTPNVSNNFDITSDYYSCLDIAKVQERS